MLRSETSPDYSRVSFYLCLCPMNNKDYDVSERSSSLFKSEFARFFLRTKFKPHWFTTEATKACRQPFGFSRNEPNVIGCMLLYSFHHEKNVTETLQQICTRCLHFLHSAPSFSLSLSPRPNAYLSRFKCKNFWGFRATRTNLLASASALWNHQ